MKILKVFFAMFFGDDIGKDKFLEDVEAVAGKLYSKGVPGLWSLGQETPVIVGGRLEIMTDVADKTCAMHGHVEKVKLRRFIPNPRKKGEMMPFGVWMEASRCRMPLPEDVVNSGDIRPALIANGLMTA